MEEKKSLSLAFNEWMRRYIEEPEQYAREFESVLDFLNDESNGVEPTYGDVCAEYLLVLLEELSEQK